MMTQSITSMLRALRALSAAAWGPTQQTLKVLHHCYVETRITFGILSWFPFLKHKYKDELETLLLRSMRLVMGLPQGTPNNVVKAEANLDSVLDLAQKNALSFYVRLNPKDTTQKVLARTLFNKKLPVWTTLLTGKNRLPSNSWRGNMEFPGIPVKFWKEPIQSKLAKNLIIASHTTETVTNTLETKLAAEIEEKKYEYLLYTDASVEALSNPPGNAAVGFIWYARHNDPRWRELVRGSAEIGSGHSSYSAESLALQMGLQNEPEELKTPNHMATGNNSTLKRIGIFTDSLSNIVTIQEGVAKTQEQTELLNAIFNYPRPITLHHVRAHHNNQKNIEVDKLCNIGISNPERINMKHLEGKKTPSKIKEWTKKWFTDGRLTAPLQHPLTNSQSWINKYVKLDDKMHPRPTFYNYLPRHQGVLLAKVRTYKWTKCNWYLNQIRKRTCALCVDSPARSACPKCEKCSACEVKDDTRHVLNNCKLHEEARSLLLKEIEREAANITDLITSSSETIIKKLGGFLTEIEDARKIC